MRMCFLLLLLAGQGWAQTVVGSARVICGDYPYTSGPIVGVIINQTNTTISDLEIELTIFGRNKKGLKRERDTRFVVIPSLNESGIVQKLEPGKYVSFSIPGNRFDQTCQKYSGKDQIANVAAIAITRINNKSILPNEKDGRPTDHAATESMLVVPRDVPQHVPTLYDLISENARLSATIVNKQLNDCLSRGTWACTFNHNTNINVVISQQ